MAEVVHQKAHMVPERAAEDVVDQEVQASLSLNNPLSKVGSFIRSIKNSATSRQKLVTTVAQESLPKFPSSKEIAQRAENFRARTGINNTTIESAIDIADRLPEVADNRIGG